jgi:hypothetical protein
METNDPLKLPRWTLAQALASMIDRSPEAVARADGKEVFDVANEAVRRDGVDDATKSVALRWRDELFGALCDGTLTAYGIGRGQSEHSPIPALAWEMIDCFYNYDGRCDSGPDDVYRSGESLPRYQEVFVRPKDVIGRWRCFWGPLNSGGAVPGEARDSPAGARLEAKANRRRRPSLSERLAVELKAMYPNGHPAMSDEDIRRELGKRPNVGRFGDTTFKVAKRKAFKVAKRKAFPKARG